MSNNSNNSNNEQNIASGSIYQIATNWFTPKVWNMGIEQQSPSLENQSWKFLKQGDMDLTFNTKTKALQLTNTLFTKESNIKRSNLLQYSCSYNSKKYFYTIPICLARTNNRNNRIEVRGGFNYVVY